MLLQDALPERYDDFPSDQEVIDDPMSAFNIDVRRLVWQSAVDFALYDILQQPGGEETVPVLNLATENDAIAVTRINMATWTLYNPSSADNPIIEYAPTFDIKWADLSMRYQEGFSAERRVVRPGFEIEDTREDEGLLMPYIRTSAVVQGDQRPVFVRSEIGDSTYTMHATVFDQPVVELRRNPDTGELQEPETKPVGSASVRLSVRGGYNTTIESNLSEKKQGEEGEANELNKHYVAYNTEVGQYPKLTGGEEIVQIVVDAAHAVQGVTHLLRQTAPQPPS